MDMEEIHNDDGERLTSAHSSIAPILLDYTQNIYISFAPD